MEQYLRDLVGDSTVGMTIKVKTPTASQQVPPHESISVEEEISIKLQVQAQYNHFQVAPQDRTTATLLSHHETPPRHLAAYQLPVYILKSGHHSLHRFLSRRLRKYEDTINVEAIAIQILNHWRQIKQQAAALPPRTHHDSSLFIGRVFPLEVTLIFWNSVMHYDYDIGMVPTSDIAIEKMLKAVDFEEIVGLPAPQTSCVICLEEITPTNTEDHHEVEDGRIILQMPCLHVFHRQCINDWLKNSHYCPTCRFQMPTKNSSRAWNNVPYDYTYS